jgi:Fur family ferric uptake transcriptional regulator
MSKKPHSNPIPYRLKMSGLKNTKQRTAILEVLEEAEQPLSAEQIFTSLQNNKVAISLSTVYRALDLMVEKDLVSRIDFAEEGKTLYEKTGGLHKHYLYCLGCNIMLPIKHCPLHEYEKELQEDTGYDIVGHKLNVYGYCGNCRNHQKL